MAIRTPAQLGVAIRDQRKRLGMQQAELAKRIGVSRQWIIELEKGHPRAELGLVLQTVTALGLTLEIFILNPLPKAKRGPDIDAIVSAAKKRTYR